MGRRRRLPPYTGPFWVLGLVLLPFGLVAMVSSSAPLAVLAFLASALWDKGNMSEGYLNCSLREPLFNEKPHACPKPKWKSEDL